MNEQQMIEHVASSEQLIKSIDERLCRVEDVTATIHVLATETKAMRESVNDILNRITEIEKRPTKRYETFITAAITALAGVLIGFIFRGGF